ncbi:MAG TPA: TetR/AcrR family transcriptional regulator [Burkholderiaceae bacterium]
MSDRNLQLRRRPKQQRAKLTQDAILEAFVRLLLEKGYARLTIRDIAAVAGVGLGTVYEHFPSKKAIAANCIHQRFKGIAAPLHDCIEAKRGASLAAMADALIDAFIAQHREKPLEWAALIYLERQVSDEAAYRSLYQYFVALWLQAIEASSEKLSPAEVQEAAYVIHAAVYGLLYQTLMCRPEFVATSLFREQLGKLVGGYISRL